MRYTTVIDISEIPAVYRCESARILYFHLALKAGYHDTDRDLVAFSLRQLADGSGLTISAVRHALHVLENQHLVKRSGTILQVRKWIAQEPISPRSMTKRQERAVALAEQERRERERRAAEDEAERRAREELWRDDKTPFMRYYEAQLAKAEAGDEEARATVEKNREMYEDHRRAVARKGGV